MERPSRTHPAQKQKRKPAGDDKSWVDGLALLFKTLPDQAKGPSETLNASWSGDPRPDRPRTVQGQEKKDG